MLLTFCLLLLPLWESVIVLCFVVRYFMSNLVLQSSWWERESWLLCLICLPSVSWWLSGSSSRCHGVVCSLWLWYFLIILTIFLWDCGTCGICVKVARCNVACLKVLCWFESSSYTAIRLSFSLTLCVYEKYPCAESRRRRGQGVQMSLENSKAVYFLGNTGIDQPPWKIAKLPSQHSVYQRRLYQSLTEKHMKNIIFMFFHSKSICNNIHHMSIWQPHI